MGEVVIGVDAHKRSDTPAAVDEVGRKLGERTVAATSEGTCRCWSGRHGGRGCGSR
jgi:transposase